MRNLLSIALLFLCFVNPLRAGTPSSNHSGADCYDEKSKDYYESKGTITFLNAWEKYVIVQLKTANCSSINLWVENGTRMMNNNIISALLMAKSTGSVVEVFYSPAKKGQIDFNGVKNYATNKLNAVILR